MSADVAFVQTENGHKLPLLLVGNGNVTNWVAHVRGVYV